jgi:peptidoglycan/xylan/chitin deacetylase (PgdA/CDA1 family)
MLPIKLNICSKEICAIFGYTLVLLLLPFLPGNGQIIKQAIPDKTVVLTFDDGAASHYGLVAPLLKKREFGATFFVCEFPPNFADSSLYMNWRQMQELDKMGFEVANHTHTHAPVGRLPEEDIIRELTYIENKFDSLKMTPPIGFAYPGYSMSPTVFQVLDQKGYLLARTGGSRPYNPLEDHPYLLPSWATDSENEDTIMEALTEAKNGKIVILTIHGVPDKEHPWVNTPPEMFLRYLDYLSENNFRVMSLKQLTQFIDFKQARKELNLDLDKPLRN